MGGRLSSDSVLAMFWVMEGAAYLITDDLELLDAPAISDHCTGVTSLPLALLAGGVRAGNF
jgi:hypothetical protein